MNLNDFYNQVSRLTDTAGSQINVAETKRVLAVAFQELARMTTADSAAIISKGLSTGAAKNKLPKKKTAKKKSAKRKTKKATPRKK